MLLTIAKVQKIFEYTIGLRYKVIEVVDNGSFAKVYKVEDERDHKIYAMKEMFPKDICYRKALSSFVDVPLKNNEAYIHFKNIFEGENKMLRTVSMGNINIPQVYSDVIFANNTCYYIMDFVDNDTLFNRLDKTKTPLKFMDTLNIVVRLAICTHKVHSMDHYHMDITPRNIMFQGKDMVPMLVDFGNSRSYDRDLKTIQHKSWIATTPGYAPPEQNQGGGINMISCDVYGLGACFYFMLTFEHPERKNYYVWEDFLAHIENSLREHDVPLIAIDVIKKCMSYHPQDRFHSMKEFLMALNELLSGEEKKLVESLEEVDYRIAWTEI